MKRVAGAIVFLIGAFLGASTRTDIWDRFSLWVLVVVLIIALTICSAGVGLWRSGHLRNEEDSSEKI